MPAQALGKSVGSAGGKKNRLKIASPGIFGARLFQKHFALRLAFFFKIRFLFFYFLYKSGQENLLSRTRIFGKRGGFRDSIVGPGRASGEQVLFLDRYVRAYMPVQEEHLPPGCLAFIKSIRPISLRWNWAEASQTWASRRAHALPING